MRDTTSRDRDNFDIIDTNKLALSAINVEDDEVEEYDKTDEIYGAHHVSFRGKSANCDIDEVIDIFEKEGYEIQILSNDGIYKDSPRAFLTKHIG